MSRTAYRECGKCGYSASNMSSEFNRSDCPRCGSFDYVKETNEVVEKRYWDDLHDWSEREDYRRSCRDNDSGSSM